MFFEAFFTSVLDSTALFDQRLFCNAFYEALDPTQLGQMELKLKYFDSIKRNQSREHCDFWRAEASLGKENTQLIRDI